MLFLKFRSRKNILVFKVSLEKEYPADKTFYLMFNKEEVKILLK
jgi:hypothetical protein